MKKILILMFTMQLIFMQNVNGQTALCPAGNIKPQLNNYSKKTICPESSVNLNTFVNAAQIPPYCEVAWFTNKNRNGYKIEDLENVTTGVYYAFYYYPEPGYECYSPASEPVYIETISCNECTQNFLAKNPLIIGGDAAPPPPVITGLVFVKNDFIFPSGTVFENAEVLVEPNVGIFHGQLQNNTYGAANLYIYGSHFYACDKPWNGIKLYATSNLTIDEINNPQPELSISSFIEDAKIAVSVDFGVGRQTANGDPSRIIIKNTIFNRNNISVLIKNLQDPQAWSNNPLPVQIESNLFTCRDIQFVRGDIMWENLGKIVNFYNNPNYITQARTYETVTPISSIYSENAERAYLYEGLKPNAGIVLENNSCQDPIECTEPQAITIGAGMVWAEYNPPNVFDNLNIGINSYTSNFNVYNCIFQNLKDINTGIIANGKMYEQSVINSELLGNGLYNETSPYNFFINTKRFNTQMPWLRFYNVSTGIVLKNMHTSNIEDCYMVTNFDVANASNEINYIGILMDSYNFTNINIANNEIYNVKYPIDMIFIKSRISKSEPKNYGKIRIFKNEIAKQVVNPQIGSTIPPNGYVHLGVNFSNFGVEHNYPVSFEIYDNKLIDVYNGMSFSNLKSNYPLITNNNISLKEDFNLTPSTEQFGIKVENGYSCSIKENTITGLGFNYDDPNLNTTKADVGILVNSQSNNHILCNDVMDSKKGIKIFGTSYSTILENRMHPSCQIGFMLDNAIIGQQGSNDPNEPDDAYTSNNSWIVDANQGTNWDASNNSYTMFCRNSDPTQSTFILQTWGQGQNPIAGGLTASIPTFNGNFYDDNVGLEFSTMPDGINIVRSEWCNDKKLNYRMKKNKNGELFNEIAEGSILIPNDAPNERLEVLQQGLYEMAKDEPTLALNEPIIQQFVANNQLSGFASIRLANHFNKLNNATGMQQVLNNWGSNPTNFEENYKTYYNWIMALDSGGTVDTPQVFAMANKCPIKEGNIVYAARNLYNQLKKTMIAFVDNCEGITARKGVRKNTEFIRLKQPSKKEVVATSTIKVYPTVSNNIINIENTKGTKKIDIINSLGKIVFSANYASITHLAISINTLPNGTYLLRTTNAIGSATLHKFVKY